MLGMWRVSVHEFDGKVEESVSEVQDVQQAQLTH
jgi:hypothetical protein